MGKSIKNMRYRHKIVAGVLIGFAVVSFWRGIWGLMDIYLFPENLKLSFWMSLFIGLAVLAATGYLHKMMF